MLESMTPACQIARKTRTPATGVSHLSNLAPNPRVGRPFECFCGAMVCLSAVELSDSLSEHAEERHDRDQVTACISDALESTSIRATAVERGLFPSAAWDCPLFDHEEEVFSSRQ